ncbi:MAG: DUF4932 domain-containing protein [Saprospiraceae bacterium]|nr:DUF4932 domain-containing protein [Saprospiraceae bacterium]MBK6667360.1 DUF4932 domain-containing protein [Saprospiraceae bacterium]MBK8888185.1 DUF4932 domain-containing protein [Saprospiraceae bacterium]MBK9580826.1 DUF4932 domain-containing protein [Saprospiraceae bacterium]
MESEMIFPDTLRSIKDSFYVMSPQFDKIYSQLITKEDTFNLGTAGYKGVYMKIWTDIDTIIIPHVNYPLDQLLKIPVVSPRDTSMCILRFQGNSSNFNDKYLSLAKGKYKIEIPEVYELANIILYLSQCSNGTGNYPSSEYANRVKIFFNAYKDHRLIQVLNNNCKSDKIWNTYYGFRENSICFQFENGLLQYNTPYKHVYWDQSQINGGQFRNLLYLVQDFADRSNFQKFYSENINYYTKLVQRQYQLLPIEKIWKWLENEFPQKMQSYKILFSPLISGSHSTQKFYTGFWGEPEFVENVMFINSPEGIDLKNELSEIIKEGLISGIVFTEIDHNYVNPTSSENIVSIKELLKEKNFWAIAEAQKNYSSEYAIFNEYMTHSLFCIYVKENYKLSDANDIIKERVKLMVKRGFPKFDEFNKVLSNILKNRTKTVYELYPEIINQMQSIK